MDVKEALLLLGFPDQEQLPKLKDITRQFRKLSLVKHPDKPGGSKEAFQELLEAYNVAGDAAKKTKFDEDDLEENIARKMFDQFQFMSITENFQTFTILIEKIVLNEWEKVLTKNFGIPQDNGTNGKKFTFQDKCCQNGFIFLTLYHTSKILIQAEKNNHNINIHFVNNHLQDLYTEVYFAKEKLNHVLEEEATFICQVCNIAVNNKLSLETHLINHHLPDISIQCSDCEKTFQSEDNLKVHSMNEHSEKGTAETSLEEDIDTVNCGKCDFATYNHDQLRSHILITHQPIFTCVHCNLTFFSEVLLKDHCSSYHSSFTQCENSDETFKITNDLAVHVESVHTEAESACSDCLKPFKDTEKHALTCGSCGSLYHKKCTEFKSATGRHWKPPTWTCENCKKSEELAVDFSGLKLHDKEPPTGARPKNPKITGKQRKSNVEVDNSESLFLKAQIVSLKVALAQKEAEFKKVVKSDKLKAQRIVVLDAQLYEQRDLIMKQSKTKHILNNTTNDDNTTDDQNQRLHTVELRTLTLEQRFDAIIAKMEAKNIATTPDCVKCHINPDNETNTLTPNILCRKCDFETKTRAELKKHYRDNHSPQNLDCEECDFSTVHSNQLQKHTRIVHPVPKFPCETCSYKALHENDLSRHIHTMHTKESFYCDSCNFECMDEHLIQDHVYREHKPTRTFFTKTRTNGLGQIKNTDTNINKKDNIQSPFPSAAKISTGLPTTESESILPHHSLVFPCKQCKLSFTAKDEVELHIEYYHAQ